MKTSHKIALACVVAALIFWTGFEVGQNRPLTAPEKQIVTIGVIAPLTGKGAERGEDARQGLALALKEIEEKNLLPHHTIKLAYQDVPLDKGKTAPAAFSMLAETERAVGIIGPMGSNPAVSAAPLADQARVPTIMHTTSARDVTKNNDYVFRLWTTADNYAAAILGHLPKEYSRIAALTAINDNTIDLLNALTAAWSEPGGAELVADERTQTEDTDFRTQLTKIKEARPDALFINVFERQIGLAAKQARELGLDIPFFSNSVMSPVELEAGGNALEGIWYPRFAGYTDLAKARFIAEFGKEPGNPDSAAAAHDALVAIATAVRDVGADKDKIKDYLYTHSFTGAIGGFRFRESGDAEVPLAIQVVRDGKISQF